MSASVTLTWDEQGDADQFMELYGELRKWGWASFSVNGSGDPLMACLFYASATKG